MRGKPGPGNRRKQFSWVALRIEDAARRSCSKRSMEQSGVRPSAVLQSKGATVTPKKSSSKAKERWGTSMIAGIVQQEEARPRAQEKGRGLSQWRWRTRVSMLNKDGAWRKLVECTLLQKKMETHTNFFLMPKKAAGFTAVLMATVLPREKEGEQNPQPANLWANLCQCVCHQEKANAERRHVSYYRRKLFKFYRCQYSIRHAGRIHVFAMSESELRTCTVQSQQTSRSYSTHPWDTTQKVYCHPGATFYPWSQGVQVGMNGEARTTPRREVCM